MPLAFSNHTAPAPDLPHSCGLSLAGTALLGLQNFTKLQPFASVNIFSLELWYFASSSFTCYHPLLLNLLPFVLQRVHHEIILSPCPLESPLFAFFPIRFIHILAISIAYLRPFLRYTYMLLLKTHPSYYLDLFSLSK